MNIQNVSNCEVVNVFNIPNTAGALVQVGTTVLVPSPFVNIDLEKTIVNSKIVGGILKIQLEGYVTGSGFDDVVNGGPGNPNTNITSVLELGKDSSCVQVIIKCGNDFIDGIGRVTAVSVPQGNHPTWVFTAPYTISIDLYTNKGQPVVKNELASKCGDEDILIDDISEQFSLSIDEDTFNWGNVAYTNAVGNGTHYQVGNRHVKVNFSITAKGVSLDPTCVDPNSSTIYTGLEAAEKYINCRLSNLRDMDLVALTGMNQTDLVNALNRYTPDNSNAYLDFRTIEIDPLNSSISVTGNVIFRLKNCEPDVLTSVTVEKTTDNEGNEIRISGTITGLVDVQYTNIIENAQYLDDDGQCFFNTKMTNANTYFASFSNEENLKAIANHPDHADPEILEDSCGSTNGSGGLPCVSILPSPSSSEGPCKYRLVTSQVSRDYAEGTINFSFTLSNKGGSCGINGVTSIEVTATHDIPRDNIVEIVVPGRGLKGVLTQNICCLSADRWNFDVNLTLRNRDCSTSPIAPVDQLRSCAKKLIEEFIIDANINPDPVTNCWFITDNQETVGNKTYRYSAQYTKPSCP